MRSNMIELGFLIRERRKENKLTQQRLGELAGTGPVFVSQLERGKETVRLDKVLTVLNVLGIKIVLSPGTGIEVDEAFKF